MAASGWKKSAGLSALAFALFSLNTPSAALADNEGEGRQGGWAERRGGGDAPRPIGDQGGWQRQQSQAPAAATPAPAPPPRAWGGGGGWQGRSAPSLPSAGEIQSPPAPLARGSWGQRPGDDSGHRRRAPETDATPRTTPVADQGGQRGWMPRRDRDNDDDGQRRRGQGGWSGNLGGLQGASVSVTPPSASGGRQDDGQDSGWRRRGGQGSGRPAWTGTASSAGQGSGTGQAANHGGDDRGGWSRRDRGYTDPNRSGEYRDGRRDRDGWRGDRRWDGDNRWDADRRSGVRSDHRNDDRWRDGQRDSNQWHEARRWSHGSHRRHGPGSAHYQPNRNHRWWTTYGWHNGSWRSNQHHYYNNGHWHRWDRNWRHDRRYDWYGWRSRHNDWFRLDYYYAPYRNYSYRRLSIGYFLDSLFFSERYWLDDPWQYRLPEVYGPYRWVRYYDDVLLVNIYTGEVVDVIHDFFW